jgi:DNA polymerase III subunit gamma/tau
VLTVTTLTDDPPCGVNLANPPRAGRQQGYAGSDGCAGGPFLFRGAEGRVHSRTPAGEDEVMAEDSEATRTAAGSAHGLALYRKYRPATFAEVRGQDHVTEPLRQALRSGRINHAYLFSGPRGCGKTSSARILARSLNCVQGPTPDPCGVCDSCVALAPSGPGSIDVIEIDAASHGGVDDARDLRERAFYAPVAGRFKIYIIDEAHMVTQQGFNALLKLVEEPPPHLKFIFATTEPEKVIPTIRSRTHHYPFRLMPPSVMSGLLTDVLNDEGVPFEATVIPLVVQAGAGSARDSLSILDQLLAGSDEAGIRYDRAVALLGYTDASLLDEMVDAFAASDGAAVFRAVNRVIESGHEPRRFATDMLDRFRDLIVLASVPDAIQTGLLTVPPDRAEALSAQATRAGLAALTRAAEIVSTGLDQMRGATSPRLLLELMCAQILLPATATDERSVLVRLERLEAGAVAPSHVPERAPVTPQGPPAPQPGRPAGPPPATAAAPAGGDGASAPAPAPVAAAASPPAARPAPPGPSAPSVPAARPAAPQAPGGATTDSLRQGWDGVLEAIKSKRRVAWMLLSNASVVSLDEGVLTLRFPRQGDVKGFASSGYEDLLKQVLHARFGVKVGIRAISGPDSGPGERRRGGPGPSGPVPSGRGPEPGGDFSGDAPTGGGGGFGGGVPAGGGGASGGVASANGGVPTDSGPGGGGGGGSWGGSPVASSAVGAPAVASPPGAALAGNQSGTVMVAGGGTPDPFGLGDVPFPADDEFDPDSDDLAVSDLSPMELVQRELGGQIIGEFED